MHEHLKYHPQHERARSTSQSQNQAWTITYHAEHKRISHVEVGSPREEGGVGAHHGDEDEERALAQTAPIAAVIIKHCLLQFVNLPQQYDEMDRQRY